MAAPSNSTDSCSGSVLQLVRRIGAMNSGISAATAGDDDHRFWFRLASPWE